MKNHFKMLGSFMVMALLMVSCENSLEILLPPGPKGDKGDKGDPGISAFELWLEVNGKDPGTPIEDFFNSLKGSDGENGTVPIIGNNGNWFIDDVDTGVPARGIDGITPVIGENGNWFIDEIDTGVPARGVDGVDGKSAYDLWKEAVDRGEMTNKDGSDYTGDNSWEAFLIWLQGGDVFILYEIWKTVPGNSGKTIEEFINELFDCWCNEVPGLEPVNIEEWSLAVFDDQYLSLTVNGTPGMTVRAMEATNHANQVTLTENPDGTYTTDQVPRSYIAYTFLLRAEMEGRQTVEIMITVDGDLLLGL